jgi:septation ring formation regulator EzrA
MSAGQLIYTLLLIIVVIITTILNGIYRRRRQAKRLYDREINTRLARYCRGR